MPTMFRLEGENVRLAGGVRLCVALLTVLVLCAAPLSAQAEQATVAPYTSSLDNGIVKVGIDADIGGAISYLSPSGSSTNLINTHDRGREVQQSYYAGLDLDRLAEGQHPSWSPFAWNPIGAGDAYGNKATVIDSTITSEALYVKTQPLLWDMRAERCECFFETWITLEGNRVRVHNKLTTSRTDNRWTVVPRDQELPATYPIAAFPRVVSYTGSDPFTDDATSDIPAPPEGEYWVAEWNTTESWGACVNASNFGIGVYTPGRIRLHGGLYGSPDGTSTSSDTCYLGPREKVPLDKTSTFEYDYWLILGTVDQIRQEVYALHTATPQSPAGFPAGDAHTWNFNADGDFGGWSPSSSIAPSSVSGGEVSGTVIGPYPYLLSAPIEKPAMDNKVVLRLRNGTAASSAQLFFTTKTDGPWTERKGGRIAILPNSDYLVYMFDMSAVPSWTGTITRLRLDPVNANGPFAIDWIRIGNQADCGPSPGCTATTTVPGSTDNPPPGFPTETALPVSIQTVPPAADTTPPELFSCTKRKQDLTQAAIRMCIRSNESVALSAGGSLTTKQPRRGRAKHSKTVKLPTVGVSSVSGSRARFELKLSKRTRRRVGNALKAGGRASASLTVTATDSAGNRAKLAISIRGKKPSGHRR
jgi:hypothetical protein